jgi:hypothetical protein
MSITKSHPKILCSFVPFGLKRIKKLMAKANKIATEWIETALNDI